MNLCDRIDYDLAKVLNNRVHASFFDDKYAAEDVVVTFDNHLSTFPKYLGHKIYKEGEYIDDGDSIHGKCYEAPTYAEVIDFLCKKNDGTGNLDILFAQMMEMSSFGLTMKDIVKKLIDEKCID